MSKFEHYIFKGGNMIFSLIFNKKSLFIIIDSVLLFLYILFYFLYSISDTLVFGILFVGVFAIHFITRLIYRNKYTYDVFELFLAKDVLIISINAVTFGIIILAANLFKTNYNEHIIFNLLFIIFICYQIYFDFRVKKKGEII